MPTNLPRAHSQHNTIQTNKHTKWCQEPVVVVVVVFLVLATKCPANYFHLMSSIWSSQSSFNVSAQPSLVKLADPLLRKHPGEQEWLSETKRLLCLFLEQTSVRDTGISYRTGRCVLYSSQHCVLEKGTQLLLFLWLTFLFKLNSLTKNRTNSRNYKK